MASQIMVMGHLTQDGALREVNIKGAKVPVVDITVAASEGWGENEKTTFWRVSIWRDAAQKLLSGLKKGRIVSVHGTPAARAYIDKNGNPQVGLSILNAVLGFYDKKPGDPEAETATGEAPAEAPAAEETEENPFA